MKILGVLGAPFVCQHHDVMPSKWQSVHAQLLPVQCINLLNDFCNRDERLEWVSLQ